MLTPTLQKVLQLVDKIKKKIQEYKEMKCNYCFGMYRVKVCDRSCNSYTTCKMLYKTPHHCLQCRICLDVKTVVYNGGE